MFYSLSFNSLKKIEKDTKIRRSDLIGGSARWRLAASQQSGAGPAQTAASYVPMNNRDRGGLDSAGPGDRSLDWERQFFDDTEPTVTHFDIFRLFTFLKAEKLTHLQVNVTI